MDCEFTCRRARQAIANIVGNTYTPIRLGAKVTNTGGIDGNERPDDGAIKKGRNKGMKLRQYQQDSVDNLMDTIQVKGNPILQLPTGAGKSIIIAEIARRMRERWGGIQILVLAHRAKLVEQDADKFAKLGLIPSVYCAELKRKEIGQFTIATILSVAKHPELFQGVHLVIVDELQMINNNDEGSYRKFLSQLPLAKVVGLSATPFRLKGGACYGPDRLFNRVAYKIGFADLVKQGYLTPPVNYDANSDDNYDDIKITAGDFNQKDMNAHFNKIVGKSCQDLVQRMRNRNYVLVFACSIVHAEAIVKALRDLGEQAEVYHSEMSLEQDKMTIARFENKEFKYLVSIDKLGVGFDAPFVDGLALMRPTMSRALAIQQLGRGSRLYEGKKDFLVADYAGNIRRHNLLEPDAYDVPYERIAKPKRSGGDAPSKVCKQCQAICATRTTQCACGYKFPPKLAVKADVQQSADVQLPIKIWRATIEESVKHLYVKLLVGAFHDARPVYFFPEDCGYSKSQTLLKWIKLFGGTVPNNCIDMCNRLNAMDGLYTEATFERKGKFFELKKLTKGDENGKSDTVPQLW